MKKLSAVLALALALTATFSLASCGEDPAPSSHTHTYATTWSFNKENHWHAATCDDAEDLIKDEAPHGTPNAEGKCPTCGYQIVGTTLEAFKATADYETKICDLVHGKTTDLDTSSGEFIWIKMDENHKVTEISQLCFGPAEAGSNTYTEKFSSFGGRDIDLKDVAEGKASLGLEGSSTTSSGTFTYDKNAQNGREALADAAVAAYKEHRGETDFEPTYTEHLLRLVSTSYHETSKTTRVMVLDVIETGYVIYSVIVPTDTEKTDAELLTLIGASAEGMKYTASGRRAELGIPIYQYIPN